jgi:hypothetical protein
MSDITRAQLGKANRALKKLGNATPTEGQKEEMILLFLSSYRGSRKPSFLVMKYRLRITPPAALNPIAPAPRPPRSVPVSTRKRKRATPTPKPGEN